MCLSIQWVIYYKWHLSQVELTSRACVEAPCYQISILRHQFSIFQESSFKTGSTVFILGRGQQMCSLEVFDTVVDIKYLIHQIFLCVHCDITGLPIHLFSHQFICPTIFLSIRLSVHPSIHPSIHPFRKAVLFSFPLQARYT